MQKWLVVKTSCSRNGQFTQRKSWPFSISCPDGWPELYTPHQHCNPWRRLSSCSPAANKGQRRIDQDYLSGERIGTAPNKPPRSPPPLSPPRPLPPSHDRVTLHPSIPAAGAVGTEAQSSIAQGAPENVSELALCRALHPARGSLSTVYVLGSGLGCPITNKMPTPIFHPPSQQPPPPPSMSA